MYAAPSGWLALVSLESKRIIFEQGAQFPQATVMHAPTDRVHRSLISLESKPTSFGMFAKIRP